MLHTASLTLLALLGSAVLALSGVGSPLAVAHLAFAVGIVPLIFAAMSHFVPVLTRTGDPGRWISPSADRRPTGRTCRRRRHAGLVALLGAVPGRCG